MLQGGGRGVGGGGETSKAENGGDCCAAAHTRLRKQVGEGVVQMMQQVGGKGCV